MMDELLQVLIQRWMTEKEAQVYLTVLQIWSAPASTVGRKAWIKRVTAYSILKEFERRHIAFSVEKKTGTYFQVVEPDALLAKLQEKYATFQQKIPEFLALSNTYSNKPRIQYFDGTNGMKAMYDDLLTSVTPIHAFLGTQETNPVFLQYLYDDFLPRRIAAGIEAKVILSASEENKKYIGIDTNALKESIMIEDELFELVTEINIYGPDKVMIALFTPDEMSGIIIQSPKFYTSMKSIFEVFWNSKKKGW